VFCVYCGARAPEGHKFCTACGNPMAAAPAVSAGFSRAGSLELDGPAPTPPPPPAPAATATPTASRRIDPKRELKLLLRQGWLVMLGE